MKNRWIRILVAVVLLGSFVYLGRRYFGKLDLLLKPNPFWLVGLFGIYLATRAVNARALRAAVGRLGPMLGAWESFMITMVISYTNLLVPHAGLGAPAMYLKRRYGLRYSDFGAVLMPLMVLQLICGGFVGLIAAAALGLRDGWGKYLPLVALFAAVAAGGSVAALLKVPVPDRWQGRIAGSLRRFGESWRLLRGSRGLIRQIVLLHLGAIFLRAVQLELAFWAVGYGGNFPEIFVASICAQFMLLISLTPGALGFREAAVTAVYEHLVGGAEVAMAAVLLDRIVMTLAILLISQVGLWQYVRPALAAGGEVADTASGNREDAPDDSDG